MTAAAGELVGRLLAAEPVPDDLRRDVDPEELARLGLRVLGEPSVAAAGVALAQPRAASTAGPTRSMEPGPDRVEPVAFVLAVAREAAEAVEQADGVDVLALGWLVVVMMAQPVYRDPVRWLHRYEMALAL